MKSWKDNVFFILVEPKEATKRIIKAAKKNKVAILFGREKDGWIKLYLFLALFEY
jgi:tRNA C32,U32 (ribose-2'-O)-methylase TrmJ